MDAEKLPTSFDVIVMGTGLPESMVSASLSRIGKKVLHIDRNDYYGGLWTTFQFKSILKWCEEDKDDGDDRTARTAEDCVTVKIPKYDTCIRNKIIKSYMPEFNKIEEEEVQSEIKAAVNDTEVVTAETHGNTPKTTESNDESKEAEIHEKTSTTAESYDKSREETSNGTDDNVSISSNSNENQASNFHEDQVSIVTPLTDNGNQADTIVTLEGSLDKGATSTIPTKKPQFSIVSQAKIKQKSADISLEDFLILSRKFNLDTAPKFLYSAGPLVQSILKANISHYTEFKTVDRILTCKDDKIIEVPCNRSDVFSSKFLSMIEKRVLMKFLTFCVELDFDEPSDELKECSKKPFQEFLKSRRLSENLQNFILYSIAMVKPDVCTLIGLQETCSFLKSLNRYGKSPFIWPLFGVAELPQAFCRMSAVFGSIFCLKKPALSITVDSSTTEQQCIKVVLDGEETIDCKHLIMNRSYVPEQYVLRQNSQPEVSLAILITDSSILSSETEHVSFLTIPPLPGKKEIVKVVELGAASSACPSGLFVFYLTATATETAIIDLEDYASLLTRPYNMADESNKPRLLWSIYFNENANNSDLADLPENIFVTCMPGSSLGFADAVSDSEKIFRQICPSDEFMMAVPNSEDIIWDTNQTTDEKGETANQEQNNTVKEDSGTTEAIVEPGKEANTEPVEEKVTDGESNVIDVDKNLTLES